MSNLKEECGLFGIYANETCDVAHTAYYALFALQHRGQENCGIVVNDERDLYDLDISSINENVNDDTTFEECDDFTKATATENEATNDEDKEYFRELVKPVLDSLPEKHRELIKKLYHIGYDDIYSVEDLCQEYNIYDEQELKRIEKDILELMKARMLKRYKKAV